MLKVDWFAQECRLEAVANLLFLEQSLFDMIEGRLNAGVKPRTEPQVKKETQTAQPPRHKVHSKSELPKGLPIVSIEVEREKAIEIAKLETHVESLAQRLAEMQALGSVEEAKAKSHLEKSELLFEIDRLKREIVLRDRGIAVLQNQIGQMKDQFTETMAILSQEESEKSRIRTELYASRKAYMELESANSEMETRLYMLLEDSYRFSEMMEDRLNLREKLQNVTAKLKKLELDVAAGTVDMSGESPVVVQLDDPIFRVILPIPYSPVAENSGKSHSNAIKTDPEGLDLAKFRIEKPGFANFVSREIPLSKADIVELTFPQWMEVMIRGLYDAKYAEHVMNSDGKGRTKFSEFVYAWMGQYSIDEKKREIIPLDWTHKDLVDARRYHLLLSISTEKAKKVWEVWTFREFLMESLDLDTLGFFLHCRNLIFRGPELQSTAGKYAVVHYIPLSHANSVIDLIMSKLTVIDRSSIKSKLEEKSRNRNGELQIDAAFVLRVLLVYYEREKREKYRQIEGLFQQVPKYEGKYIDFSGFKQVAQNFYGDICDLDLVNLYRQVWSLNHGVITPETFYTAANESCLLSSTLRLGSFWPQPTLNAYNDLETGLSPLHDHYASSVSDWKASSKRLEVLKEAVTKMGLIGVTNTIAKIEGILRRKGQQPLEETNGRHLSESYVRLWAALSQAGVVHLELYGTLNWQSSKEDYVTTLNTVLNDLKSSCRGFHSGFFRLKVDRFVLKLAVNRIQRAWKAKRPKHRKSMRRGAFIYELPSF